MKNYYNIKVYILYLDIKINPNKLNEIKGKRKNDYDEKPQKYKKISDKKPKKVDKEIDRNQTTLFWKK
jgi:hypothetical protein